MNRQIAGLGRRSAYALLNLFTGLVSLVFLPVLLLCALLCLLGIGLVLLPEIAALTMSGSSILVAVNALMLKRLPLPEQPAHP